MVRFVRELAEYERELDQVKVTEEQLARDLFRERPAVFAHIAEDADGRAVGFALWFLNYSTWEGSHGIYLEDLYVTPEARGDGYGRALLTELARIAVERGYSRFEWACLDWNEPSIRFYRGLGARAQEEWTVHRLAGDTLRSVAGA